MLHSWSFISVYTSEYFDPPDFICPVRMKWSIVITELLAQHMFFICCIFILLGDIEAIKYSYASQLFMLPRVSVDVSYSWVSGVPTSSPPTSFLGPASLVSWIFVSRIASHTSQRVKHYWDGKDDTVCFLSYFVFFKIIFFIVTEQIKVQFMQNFVN